MGSIERLTAVTPIDGRYGSRVEKLVPIVSEYGLVKRRLLVEAEWLALLGSGVLPDVPPFDDETMQYLHRLPDEFDVFDDQAIKDIESQTNHDVKAVEVWMRQMFANHPTLRNHLELIHFGLTSEDINNLAYALMIRDARDEVLVPGITVIVSELDRQAHEYADINMLAHTHGQPATPTTLGKEMRVFERGLRRSAEHLGSVAIEGKLNGATGNYNALHAAYPDVNWREVAIEFVESLGFEFNPITTQIEPHHWVARFMNELALNNSIMTDAARDIWTYISMGYFKQIPKSGEVGSSTMPHKVNPIDFENAESNLQTANALARSLAERLPISRMQRDLSDSSTLRNVGPIFGHTTVAHASMKRGLGKISPNEAKIAQDLDGEYSILTEAVQTVMRRFNIPGSYDIIKEASRGQEMDEEAYHRLISLISAYDIPETALEYLKGLAPSTYSGYSRELARQDKD
ncbi:MAG TPA: adenylosuccinate lyase [Candidatus Saccharimonadales bacterium]|nr:adenylosuccinate lyase [Candidatus Saccharimonadales bacterium]